MAKHRTSDRRRFARIPSGGGFSLVHRLPPGSDRLPGARLSPAAKRRLAWMDYAATHGVAATCRHFGISRTTFHRWRRRYDPNDLSTLEDRSRRPRRVRRPTWTAAQAEAVRQARLAHPRWGKDKLAVVLRRQGVTLSVSMVGRILADLKRRGRLVEPRPSRLRPHARHPRPYAVRRPRDRAAVRPGDLVQLDTMHLTPLPGVERRQFTAVDVVSRVAVLGVRAVATAGTARAFLAELRDRLPFPVRAIQVDGGSEFMAGFETACREAGIALYVLPPRSPKLNGCVERLNGTCRREFWECHDGPLELPDLQAALRDWERQYNHERPHQALDYATPAAHLAALPATLPADDGAGL